MVLVLGIGNSLLQDEGIGHHLLKKMEQEKSYWPATFLDGGTLSFNLASTIELYDHVIILDAANLHQRPGTVEIFYDTELDEFLNKPGKSVHEVSISDLFDMTRLTGTMPQHRAMVAIQPETIDWGEALTEAVYNAQPQAIEQVEKILMQWNIIQ